MKTKNCENFAKPKYLLAYLLVLSGALTACAQDEKPKEQFTCATMAGTYLEPYLLTTLTIDASCNFTDSVCGYDASYTVPSGGFMDITIHNTNGTPGCMSNTTHLCAVEYSGLSLAVDCGGPHVYLFQKL